MTVPQSTYVFPPSRFFAHAEKNCRDNSNASGDQGRAGRSQAGRGRSGDHSTDHPALLYSSGALPAAKLISSSDRTGYFRGLF